MSINISSIDNQYFFKSKFTTKCAILIQKTTEKIQGTRSNTLDWANSIEVLEEAIRQHGAPEIINSNQGSQYTPEDWTQECERHNITISIDGRGRAKDNIWIERFWRTLKMEYVYLNPTSVVNDLRNGIRGFIEYSNRQRHHQGIDGKVPWDLFLASA